MAKGPHKRVIQMKLEKTQSKGVHQFEIKQLLIGVKTFLLIAGFIISGIVLGRTIWEYFLQYFGLFATLIISFTIFIITGMKLRKFNNK